MPVRYFRFSDKQRIAEALHVENMSGILFQLEPCYNVSPQSFQLVVRADEETTERELAFMRWGLIPNWSKDDRIAHSTVNAKAETLGTNPTFREPFRLRRCLIPADGYFDWKQLDARNKQPYAFAHFDGEPIAFGGVWARWNDRVTRRPLETFSIITTAANELTAQVSERMPLIIAPADYRRWLLPADPEEPPTDLLRPYPGERMTLWKVGAELDDIKLNSPKLIERAWIPGESPERRRLPRSPGA